MKSYFVGSPTGADERCDVIVRLIKITLNEGGCFKVLFNASVIYSST